MTTPKKLTAPSTVSVFTEPPAISKGKRSFKLEFGDFVKDENVGGKKIRKTLDEIPYLILGFDTEFKTPDYLVNKLDIKEGRAKYRVLSYQFHAKLSSGEEWQGICCPEGDERMTMGEFISFALGKGVTDHGISNMPTRIYLAGHFTRADIPAFGDFQDQTAFMSSVRGSFVSIDDSTPLNMVFDDENDVRIDVFIRDTMLLTPQASKSLKEIGKLVGVEKVELHPDRSIYKEMIRNMDSVRDTQWDLFRRYALTDAEICVRYIERVIDQYQTVTGKKKVPLTLTSIGVDLLVKSWTEKLHVNHLDVLGKEEVFEQYFDKRKNRYIKKKVIVDVEKLSWHVDFITSCYHGGRNEQFWYGPGPEGNWLDLDLASAYPTAMSIIGLPKWDEIAIVKSVDEFTPTTLGFACVDFEFPPDTRYPTLPVRTEHGLIFPLTGRSYCSSPEITLALELGCKLTLIQGVIVPTKIRTKIFGEFIKDCINQRIQAGSKTLAGLFWKEISNSTYGKTAQGLRKKRVYDLRDRDTHQLPPSRITNPCFAAYITSFVRALLGEIMNRLPVNSMVFSCTTDGFITNIDKSVIKDLQGGTLGKIYSKSRMHLVGSPEILEIKHEVRQPIGWKTRGQATLKSHPEFQDEEYGIVLAKGGIFTKPESEEDSEQNDEIIRLFFDRTSDSVILVESMVGVRDIVENNADLVVRQINKKLNMEYDWKRQSLGCSMSKEYPHIYFSTRPWHSLNQFVEIRNSWEEYTKNDGACLKSVEDFDAFADYVEAHTLSQEKSKYLKRSNPDINRLRQALCCAWQQRAGGVLKGDDGATASQFAAILSAHGVPCKRTDVENGKKKTFEPHSVPATTRVKSILEELKGVFPYLKPDEFLYQHTHVNVLTLRPHK